MFWNLGRKFSAAMTTFLVGGAVTAIIAVVALRTVVSTSDEAALQRDDALLVANLRSAAERSSATARAFLLTRDDASRERCRQAREVFLIDLVSLESRARTPDKRVLYEQVEVAERRYGAALEHVMDLREDDADRDALLAAFADVSPAKAALDDLLRDMAMRARGQLGVAELAVDSVSSRATAVVVLVAMAATLTSAGLAYMLRAALRDNALQAERLAGSNRDLDAFAGRVAHDLRNALAPVIFSARVLLSGELLAETRRTCERLDRAAQRTVGLIDALLAFSRADGPADPHAICSVRSAVDDVLDELEPQLVEAAVDVETDIADVCVRCSPGFLRMIVVNLVGNAIKFVRGRPERRVRIEARPSGPACVVRVDDTGPGIPEEARERVFEPFYRVPGTNVGGTGIGLATVRRIAEAHGGGVSLESTLGERSSFRVFLPLAFEGLEPSSAAPRLEAAHPQ
jgi:signal transduction histidine kinase